MRPPVPLEEVDRLRALHELEVLDTPPESEFDDLVALASRICGVPMSLVSLIDADRQWHKARVGTDAVETSRDLSFCAHAILGRDLMVVPDATADPRFAEHPAVVDDPGVRFYAGAPLITTEGFALGTLCVVDAEPRRLTLSQLQALPALARQVTAQLELRRYGALLERSNARLHELERHLDEFAELSSKLREPLTAMRAYLDAPATACGVQDMVMANAHPLGRLVDNLLELAGPAPAGALHLREVNLSYLVQRAVEAVRPIGDAKHVPVTAHTATPIRVHADPVRLEQALSHLLFSAVKYAPEGGRVEVSTAIEAGPVVRVHDRDLIPGKQPSLFRHFYEGALAGGGRNRGLGIVKAIFDAHHATVAMADRPCDGTSLLVVFPLSP